MIHLFESEDRSASILRLKLKNSLRCYTLRFHSGDYFIEQTCYTENEIIWIVHYFLMCIVINDNLYGKNFTFCEETMMEGLIETSRMIRGLVPLGSTNGDEFCAIAASIETLDPLASRVSNSATAIPRMLQTGSYFKYRYREIISCCVRD